MPLDFIKQVGSGSILGLWRLSESLEELESTLPHLTLTAEYTRLNHNLRKKEWLGARVLLNTMDLSSDLNYTEHGKPFYPKGPKISLSHSKDYIGIITNPTKEVGIDIQEHVEKVNRIKEKFCNEHELKWAYSLEDLIKIWCAKEALFKIQEKNVLFKEDISVENHDSELKVTFKNREVYHGFLISLHGYTLVHITE